MENFKTQSLTGVLQEATARGQANEVVDKASPKPVTKTDPKLPEKSFFEKELERKIADPTNRTYHAAVAIGKQNAVDFLDHATSEHHIQHRAAFARFKDEFDLDPKKVEDHFVGKSCEALQAFPFDLYDPKYIQNLKTKFKPTGNVTPQRMKFWENFCNAVDEKHKRIGTKGDALFVKNYTGQYCLEPNNQVSTLAEFQPKK